MHTFPAKAQFSASLVTVSLVPFWVTDRGTPEWSWKWLGSCWTLVRQRPLNFHNLIYRCELATTGNSDFAMRRHFSWLSTCGARTVHYICTALIGNGPRAQRLPSFLCCPPSSIRFFLFAPFQLVQSSLQQVLRRGWQFSHSPRGP